MAGSDKATVPAGGTDPPGADRLVGRTLDGRYRLKRVLGEGGMGVVYLATHEKLDKSVAVKVLRPEVSRDAKTVARFKREARAASAIGSAHICDVSDFGETEDGSVYFVMELLDGPSLSKITKTKKPIEETRILKIGAQLCEALGAAHAQGIVHRDLKPDNVHLVRQGKDPEFVKVLDFGIAKVADSSETKLTQAGQVFGTPHYMSPEQCAGHDVDARTDVYALGVMIYELACGQVPFQADNLMGLLTKHVYESPPHPSQLTPPVVVSPNLEAVIFKCLAKQPESRYPSMDELKADLETMLEGGTPVAATTDLDRRLPTIPDSAYMSNRPPPMTPVITAPPHTPAPSRSPYAALAGGALVALLGLGAIGYVIFGQPEPDPNPVVIADPPTQPDPPPVDVPEHPPTDPPADPPAPAMIALTSTPEGAEVTLEDGTFVANTPASLPRPERATAYRLTLAGHVSRTVTLGPESNETVGVTLEAEPTRVGRRRRSDTTTQTETDHGQTQVHTQTDPVGPDEGDLHRVPELELPR
ncbi:MAG: serine/threonine protein kinase [Sandaracinaceae bacterium]